MLKYFEKELNKKLEYYKNNPMYDAVKYSMTVGGKRIRPLLVLNLAKSLNKDYKKIIDLAIAIEFIHNYSLIHDDLPSMDNDTYRRGNLTTHAKFGEYMGILVGDALLTEAFYIISSSKTLKNKSKIIEILSKNIGYNGMILGQVLDMQNENKNIDKELIELIHQKKTAELISACFECTLAEFNISDDSYITVAKNLGLLYQIQDDFFDLNNENDKSNYVKLIGENNAKKIIIDKTEEIKNILKNNKEFLEYILNIINRKY